MILIFTSFSKKSVANKPVFCTFVSMKQVIGALVLISLSFSLSAQVFNSANLDTSDIQVDGKLSIHGFVDAYYTYSFNEPKSASIPYQVSSNRHNEININLAYVDFRYSSSRIRASFVPAFGTYNNANYANEPSTLKNLLEANAGVCLSTKRRIWMDVGVLTSPITNESPVSKDQFLYSRSLAAEYSPYFVTGARLIVPVSDKLNINTFLLNGWQQTQSSNADKSLAVQFEFRPNNQHLINLNFYTGNAHNNPSALYRQRTFVDVYWIRESLSKKLSYSVNAYLGRQEIHGSSGADFLHWYTLNAQLRYWFKKAHGLGARIEYFNDPKEVVAVSVGPDKGLRCSGFTLAYNYQFLQNSMVRLDARYYHARDASFTDYQGNGSTSSFLLGGNFSVWF